MNNRKVKPESDCGNYPDNWEEVENPHYESKDPYKYRWDMVDC